MKSGKNLDFEINLLPVISILAVCISTLLVSAVWVKVSSFNLNQAFGTEGSQSATKSPESIWVQFDNSGSIAVAAKNIPSLPPSLRAQVAGSSDNMTGTMQTMTAYVNQVKRFAPNIQIALILPASNTKYEEMVSVMDALRKNKIGDIGIAPL